MTSTTTDSTQRYYEKIIEFQNCINEFLNELAPEAITVARIFLHSTEGLQYLKKDRRATRIFLASAREIASKELRRDCFEFKRCGITEESCEELNLKIGPPVDEAQFVQGPLSLVILYNGVMYIVKISKDLLLCRCPDDHPLRDCHGPSQPMKRFELNKSIEELDEHIEEYTKSILSLDLREELAGSVQPESRPKLKLEPKPKRKSKSKGRGKGKRKMKGRKKGRKVGRGRKSRRGRESRRGRKRGIRTRRGKSESKPMPNSELSNDRLQHGYFIDSETEYVHFQINLKSHNYQGTMATCRAIFRELPESNGGGLEGGQGDDPLLENAIYKYCLGETLRHLYHHISRACADEHRLWRANKELWNSYTTEQQEHLKMISEIVGWNWGHSQSGKFLTQYRSNFESHLVRLWLPYSRSNPKGFWTRSSIIPDSSKLWLAYAESLSELEENIWYLHNKLDIESGYGSP